MISALAAPYTQMKFMPTGGVSPKNMKDYLSNPKIIACGGTWMIDKKAMQEKNFAKIEELTRQAVREMLEIKIKHIGINASNEEEADGIATSFEKLFGFTKNVGNSSIFAGTGVEVMKTPYLGRNGHIAVQTNYIERAIYHMELQGFEFDPDTAKYDKKGNMVAIYLKGEIGGFAVHLVQKK